ncbi:MAG TPA: AsmA-like C-terminal domain-containing protein [Geobacteraceae bacterium]|nr:AsmA-like C-terminal domain-containing protein [Geobacteraceae bacterium]
MKPIYKKIILVAILSSLVLLGREGVTFILNNLFHLDAYKDQIVSQVQQSLNRKVLFGKGTFSFRLGPEFIFTQVTIKEKDGATDFITADRLTIRIALIPLFAKKMVLRSIEMEKPVIAILRDREGLFNFSDLLTQKEKPGEIQLLFRRLRIRNGEILIKDLAVTPQGLSITLKETEFSTSHLSRGEKADFKLSTTILQKDRPGTIVLAGSAKIAAKDRPFTETAFNATISTKNLDCSRFWPYYSGYVPFKQILGGLDMESRFKGRVTDFTSKGTVGISGLRFDYPQVFHSVLLPREVKFSYEMSLDPSEITVNSLNLTVDGLNVRGSCALRDIRSGDLRITAQAKTSQFNLENFGQYIPYGIIVKDTADYIEQHIKGGIYRLDDGRLDGRVSQIIHMESGTNYNVLFINGRVEKGVVSYGPNNPTFNSISGTLEMRGKDFILHRMSGNFGISPFTLEGKITNYPLTTPCEYPFTMIMTPRQPEIAWLLGKMKGGKPGFIGETTLHLAGNGTTDNYNLAGDWNLTTAAYSYPDLISKPAGWRNSLSFKGNVTKQAMKVSSLQFNLLPLVLNFGATYSYNDKEHLALEIRTNQFQVKEVAAMLPRFSKYQPAGRVQAALHGESTEQGLADLRWQGNVLLNDFSCKPGEAISTLSNVNGVVNVKGDTLETSQITAHIGNSAVTGRGKLKGFSKPELELVFSSPSLDPADFGIRTPQHDFRLAGLQGNIALHDNDLQIKSFTTHLNRSVINLKGTVQDLDNPVADLSLTSPYLEVEDIVHAGKLERIRTKGVQTSHPSLTMSLQVDAGKVHGIGFEKLNGTLIYENNILYLQPLSLSAMEGDVSGKVRIDFGSSVAPHYQISYNLQDISAESFIQALGVRKQEITGTMGMQGELTAKGNTAEELKKTLLGSTKVHFEEGKLRKFATLSKIFSLLNVSQLLKFQLPDMVSGGMPYHKITATLSIKDGIVSSNDLYVASDAINISSVGKADLVKGELDATIGVKPLQTIDKVVSHIPIVGWILTGKNRSFLTAYFEAKGKLEDPTVTAIPVQSMAKGVFNIFKRVFQLPARLFTDTGEVIIGK